ncbi:hypothetical protein ASC95_27015 [Pelomonas sp. Root1217]|uniref:DUF6701 domain-containing protein n=1 Tax=Pelomonas sp. Root1217 TaxID=1736430 RepID=UPI00070BEB61|nr:DUF6701 domain-containing protein [Pelomonas sp. Root1217]KQV46255.1 hypothetical protein ASC95_27015 [Pelomonas sp. Root1217]
MHTARCLLLIALALLCGFAQAASSYTFRSDSYAWETAANTLAWDRSCTSYPGDDDKATITFTGGFKFTFAGTAYTAVRVLTNGGLQFGTDTGFFRTYTNTALPASTADTQSGCAAAATTNVILAYWTDLDPSRAGSGGVTWEQKGTAPNRYVVVSWNGVYQYNTSTPYTFQIILFENGEFKYQYGNANASGSNATIGVQVSSSDTTQYSYNSGYNANGSAIRWFVPNGTPTRRAEYRFDEWNYSGRVGEVADSSGNSNNGVRVGNAATSATAKVCRSLSIPTDTTSASHAVDTLLDVNSGIGDKGAVTFWYDASTAWNNSAAMLLDATTSTSKPFFLVRQSDGSLRLTITDSNGLVVSTATPVQSVAASTWKHIGVTWNLAAGTNQSTLRIYLNGVQIGATTATTSGSLDNSIGTLFVGDNRSSTAPTNGTLRSANGLIDEMRVYNYEISALELTADMAAISRVCLPPLDHYELSLPKNSLTCLPTTVTVKACSTNASSCSVETSINGTAVLTTSAGTLSPGTVTFNNGLATATLSLAGGADDTDVTVTLGSESTTASTLRRCCPDGVSCAAANSCTTNFKRAGFIVSDAVSGAEKALPAHTAGTQTGAFYYLRAVKSGTSTQACEAALTGSNNVNWAYQCSDPTTCSGSNLMTIASFTPGTFAAKASTVIQRNNNGATLSYTPVAMAFDNNGNAPFKLTFADVGKTLLHFNFTASVGSGSDLINGSSQAFVTKPAGFSVTQITTPAGVANNGSAASPGIFVRAGTPFSARITALTSNLVATPNFGKEAVPAGVLLTPTLVAPAGGFLGTLDNNTVAGTSFTNGVANVTNLDYREVGLMSLKGTVAGGDYLGAGDATASAASETIGRFIPAGFTVTPGVITHRATLACAPASAFTYLNENFSLGFTLSAVNAQGGLTRNYAGNIYSKLDIAATNFNLAGVDTTGGVTTRFPAGRLTVAAVAGAWPAVGDPAAGAAVVTLTAAALRSAAPDGPFDNTKFGIAPTDLDGVGMAAFDLDTDAVAGNDRASVLLPVVGQIPLRYGRLRLQNALSAANRTLKLPLTAQSWNGTAFVTNALDSCTRITAANLSFGNFRKTLTAQDAVMYPNVPNTAVVVNPLQPTYITLAAPGGGRLGSMDVAVALGSTPTDASCLKTGGGWVAAAVPATTGANLASLRGAWCGAAATSDPSARATWGLYRGSDGVVYQRENY